MAQDFAQAGKETHVDLHRRPWSPVGFSIQDCEAAVEGALTWLSRGSKLAESRESGRNRGERRWQGGWQRFDGWVTQLSISSILPIASPATARDRFCVTSVSTR